MKTRYHFSVIVISFLLVLLFSYAAISKLIDYHNFLSQLKDSALLNPIAAILVWLIPSVELYVVTLLLIPGWRKQGLIISSILMLMFTGYISIMLMFFEKIPCSCGGVLQKLSWHQHLAFNIIFLILALAGAIITHKQENQNRLND
jgi:uncharacterized membrane protein YphA (DoxX/SURF4 family)